MVYIRRNKVPAALKLRSLKVPVPIAALKLLQTRGVGDMGEWEGGA